MNTGTIPQRNISAIVLAIAFLAGCSSAPPVKQSGAAEQSAAKPTQLATGREAFQKLYATARMWAADVRPVRVESQATQDAGGLDGKSAVWRALFVSASRRSMRTFLWSGESSADAPERGISHGSEESWNPANVSTQPFDIVYIRSDSDAAFATAQKHGGDKVLKKDEKLPVLYVLDWDPRKSQLVWRVIYGVDRNDARLVVDVDASTGNFVRVEG